MVVGTGGADARWPRADEIAWLSPEELVEEGFRRSRVVMMNEAHSGLRRNVRTRLVGTRILPVARACGARLVAIEMLGPPGGTPPPGGVLGQPEMVAFLDTARRLGLRLAGYDVEDDTMPVRLRTKVKSPAFTNWRDGKQAANLAALLAELPEDAGMLVWSANLHHAKVRLMAYRPTGWRFQEQTGVEPFVIDQTVTVNFGDRRRRSPVLDWARGALGAHGGTAGFLWEQGLPRLSPGCDAWLLSLDNDLE